MLTVRLEVLVVVVVVVSIRLVVTVLVLWAKLVHLLRTGSKLVWTTSVASHSH